MARIHPTYTLNPEPKNKANQQKEPHGRVEAVVGSMVLGYGI